MAGLLACCAAVFSSIPIVVWDWLERRLICADRFWLSLGMGEGHSLQKRSGPLCAEPPYMEPLIQKRQKLKENKVLVTKNSRSAPRQIGGRFEVLVENAM
jgi:hypothetical protein